MELVNDWDSLPTGIIHGDTDILVPPCRLREIQQRCFSKRVIAIECASYYVHCHPQPSWTHLASDLYTEGEFAAVEKIKLFLPLRGKCQA
jgi:pimeloyl-ACP methyl ester carboxylesterase